MRRYYWRDQILAMEPERDYQEIYQIMVGHEFPWDVNQALSLALFRTYAVPSIGSLLAETGEFTARTQKRYDDTELLLAAIIENGFDSMTGRSAVRRINQMHRAYAISNDDMRYVLATFVVTPIRWLDAYGWRWLTDTERVAVACYYRELGRRMNIRDIPADHHAFAQLLDDYENTQFSYNAGGRAVADATLELMTTFTPQRRVPASLARQFAIAILDDRLITALGYTPPSAAFRALARAGLRLRGRLVRWLPPRTEPLSTEQLANVRSYPDGYTVPQLGTFPAGCPHRALRDMSSPSESADATGAD